MIWVFILPHILRVYLNFKIYNLLHPHKTVRFKLTHPGEYLKKSSSGRRDIQDNDGVFILLNFIFIWLRFPQSKKGKVKVWLVHLLSFIQILSFILLGFGAFR